MDTRIAAGLLVTCALVAPPGPALAKDPYFGFLTSALLESRSGPPASVTCVRGEHPRGVTVALLYRDGSNACLVKTGGHADPVAGGPCTILVDATRCAKEPVLALIGSKPTRYRFTQVETSRDRSELTALDVLVRGSGVLDRLVQAAPEPARPRGPMQVDALPFEVLRLRGVSESPAFVRYGVTHEGRHQDNGPVVALFGQKVSEAAGPVATLGDAVDLDGKVYVLLWTGCFGCGWNQVRFFCLEKGGLRLMRETSEAAL